jgi:rhomboid family GlyGly-CTERM serine protease
MHHSRLSELKTELPGHFDWRDGSLTPRELPLLAAALAIFALAAGLSPATASILEFDRVAIASGQFYRLLTGHLAHWSFDHLLWDVVMFATLGAFLERSSRWLLLAVLAAAAPAVSAAIWLLQPDMLVYRGLSGVDSALFAAALVILLIDAVRSGHKRLTAVVGLLALGFAAKVGFEMSTGITLFVDSQNAGFTPLPLAHAVGAASGGIAAALYQRARPMA